ncbi:AGAP001029-PA-like protein [Anopheles sinensis]|uniref:AGAP001029-PA-like protein n=1 Tax=Anopheles sinensis TaxID=74873 RepID=A0A084VMB4_ANOSI|nr:AGAP001029-PA-like protein [Anopheles sinensis]
MYASGNGNFFTEISSFSELKYASPVDDEPASKKQCVLAAFGGLPKEHTQTSGAFLQPHESNVTSMLVTASTDLLEESFLSNGTKPSNGAKQKKESGLGAGLSGGPVSTGEEVLGSVTTFYPAGDPENGHTLRTSARVKHKMRMETIHNNPVPTERKEQPKASGAVLPKTITPQKPMRAVWSNHDKNLFFEALNEYGKDFESILNYLNSKKRRKDNACEQQVFKTKDVRNLYYQFNQKISKYLHFSDEVKKEAQELYALINYGEMRKKVPFQKKKYFQKLKDLVYKGFTMVREKGKTIRIKTPSCRALRKLNQLEEWQEEIKLPTRVEVLLQPANMEAWGRVQSLAQNPRVRITVTTQKRVSALLQLFQQKWRPQELRLVERVEKMKIKSATVTSKLMRQRMQNEIQLCSQLLPSATSPPPSATCVEPTRPVLNLQLHFVPSHSAVIHRPMISLAEFQSNTSICLNSYEQRIGVKVRGETLVPSEKVVGAACKKPKLCLDSGHDSTKDETHIGSEQLSKLIMNELLKSPNASNESMDLKDMDLFEMELLNGHSARSMDDCDGPPATNHAHTTNTSVLSGACGSDPANARMSDNSNDEFVLADSEPMKYDLETLAEHTIVGDEDACKEDHVLTVSSSTITTCVTTVISTSSTSAVRKKCPRRKGSDAAMPPPTGVFNHIRPLVSEQEIQRIREGWTLYNANDLTIGDLYIMFGEDMKLHLEYDWVWKEAPLPRTVPPVDVKATSDEQSNAMGFPAVATDEAQQSTKAIDSSSISSNNNNNNSNNIKNNNDKNIDNNTTSTADDVIGSISCSAMKEEPLPVGTNNNRDGSNVISKRLKQLVMLMNMGGKNGKKRCICGNATERKLKQRTDYDNTLSTCQDDSLLFKQPMLPARNGVNYLTPEPMHMPPQARYKQSRWLRTRMNRHQGLFSPLPMPRTPHPSVDMFPPGTPDANSIHGREGATRVPSLPSSTGPGKGGKRNGSTFSLPTNSFSDDGEPEYPGADRTIQVPYAEENANDIGAGQTKFTPTREGGIDQPNQTNPTSSNAPVGGSAREASDENAYTETIAGFAVSEACSTTITAAPALPQNDDSCLSLFHLSLPSTSSSLMANIFSGTETETDVGSALLPSSPVDTKILENALNDISLTSFFGQLDAVYQSAAEPAQPCNNFDLDITTMSENSVDYIARFENIASDLREKGNS